MQSISNLIDQKLPNITTNTLIFIIIAVIAFCVLMKVMSNIIKIIALIAICWFVLMSVQSTNAANIPLVKQAYTEIERVIPSKELWTKASSYINDIGKIKEIFKNK